MSFGDGRIQNLVYVATPNGENADVMVVLSLMQSGGIEVRVLRGAPQGDAAAAPIGQAPPLFGLFTLEKRHVPCAP